MIIDGKALAGEIIREVKVQVALLPQSPKLTVFTCAPNFETKKFLALKQKQAIAAGITLTLVEFPQEVTLGEVESAIFESLPETDGIVIQFPFPAHLATADLIAMIPATHDVDAFSYNGTNPDLLPPVVGAIDIMAKAHAVTFVEKDVVIVGNGRLVGAPAATYARINGAHVSIVTKETVLPAGAIESADILILGAGVPSLITINMVKSGVIVFDAGTSEEGGMLVGDASPLLSEKAALLTPVPGGIGPLTIAILLKNVLYLANEHRKNQQNVV